MNLKICSIQLTKVPLYLLMSTFILVSNNRHASQDSQGPTSWLSLQNYSPLFAAVIPNKKVLTSDKKRICSGAVWQFQSWWLICSWSQIVEEGEEKDWNGMRVVTWNPRELNSELESGCRGRANKHLCLVVTVKSECNDPRLGTDVTDVMVSCSQKSALVL